MAKLNKLIWIGLSVSGITVISLSLFIINRMQEKKAEESFRAGETSLAAGRASDAIAHFQESFEIDPNHPQAGFLLFDTTLLLEPDTAEEILIRLEKTNLPGDRITARRILLHLEKGDIAEAIQLRGSLASVAELDFDRAYAEIQVDLASTKTATGEESLQYLLDRFPSDRRVLLVEARILQTSQKTIDHVRAKTLLKDLLNEKDLLSFEAARLLMILSRIPMFEKDLSHALVHLLTHPCLDRGLQKMELSDLRLLALRSVEQDPEAAFRFAQVLVNREGATDNDQLLYLSIAQKTGDKWKETGPVISRLREGMQDNTDIQLVLARQDFLEGRPEEMISKLKRVLDSDPENQAALNLLLPLVEENSPGMSTTAQASARDMIIGHPLTPTPDRLLAYSGKIETQPAKKADLIQKAVDEFAGQDPILVGLWLNDNKAFEESLGLVPEERAITNLDAFSIRFEALMALENWEAATGLLNSAQTLLTDFQTAYCRARIHVGQGNTSQAQVLIKDCLELLPSGPQRERLFDLAGMASVVNSESLQKDAYQRALSFGMKFPQSHAYRYLDLLLKDNLLSPAKEFSSYIRKLDPDNPAYINNDCYLGSLLEQGLEQNIRDMKQLIEQYPEVGQFRITLALAQFLGGLEKESFATINKSEVPLDLANPQSKFVFALALAGGNQRGAALSIVDSIDREKILEQEWKLIERFLISGE